MELNDATVLIVDDESMLLEMFRGWLQDANYRVFTAGDGSAALSILDRHHVDVIVSDIRMPVMDGILLLKNLTTYSIMSRSTRPPKMIFVSGFTDLEPREAYDLGCEALMHKPFTRDHFVATVRRALRPREETWAEPEATQGQQLRVALPTVLSAIDEGRIAFGRGGYCLRYSRRMMEGPVRFDIEFQGEKVSLAGHGLTRWVDPEQGLIGVEISNLDEPCREWAIDLINRQAGSSYIPRAPMLAPTFKTAR